VYAPISYILPSRLKKYEEMYDTQVQRRQRQARQPTAKEPAGLMTTNLLKRLESSVQSFRLTLQSLRRNHKARWPRSPRSIRPARSPGR
jgi:hypothetical protein